MPSQLGSRIRFLEFVFLNSFSGIRFLEFGFWISFLGNRALRNTGLEKFVLQNSNSSIRGFPNSGLVLGSAWLETEFQQTSERSQVAFIWESLQVQAYQMRGHDLRGNKGCSPRLALPKASRAPKHRLSSPHPKSTGFALQVQQTQK